MADSRLLKILVPIDIKSLTMTERICNILIYTVPLLLFAIFMTFLSHDFFCILLWILYVILFIPWYYYILAYERLEKKYKMWSDIRFGNPYEVFSKFLASFAPGIIVSIMTIAYLIDEVILGLAISSAFIIPSLALFIRDDVFNDESCIEGEEIILGYTPAWYGLLSAAIGIFGYLNAVKSDDLTMSMSLVTVTLIFQMLAVFPDKLNSLLFFEVRRIGGCLALLFSLAAIFLIICSLIIGHPVINPNNFDLSFEGILRKVITWGTAIILAILFLRKIKSMNKK